MMYLRVSSWTILGWMPPRRSQISPSAGKNNQDFFYENIILVFFKLNKIICMYSAECGRTRDCVSFAFSSSGYTNCQLSRYGYNSLQVFRMDTQGYRISCMDTPVLRYSDMDTTVSRYTKSYGFSSASTEYP